MTYKEAVAQARKNHHAGSTRIMVVNESLETSPGEGGFDTADQEDLDTFYLGAKVIFSAEED